MIGANQCVADGGKVRGERFADAGGQRGLRTGKDERETMDERERERVREITKEHHRHGRIVSEQEIENEQQMVRLRTYTKPTKNKVPP